MPLPDERKAGELEGLVSLYEIMEGRPLDTCAQSQSHHQWELFALLYCHKPVITQHCLSSAYLAQLNSKYFDISPLLPGWILHPCFNILSLYYRVNKLSWSMKSFPLPSASLSLTGWFFKCRECGLLRKHSWPFTFCLTAPHQMEHKIICFLIFHSL